jgi:hypothetical protein
MQMSALDAECRLTCRTHCRFDNVVASDGAEPSLCVAIGTGSSWHPRVAYHAAPERCSRKRGVSSAVRALSEPCDLMNGTGTLRCLDEAVA